MGTNKTYIHGLWCELNQYYESEVISLYIKNISLVTYCINTIESSFYICKRIPFSLLSLFIPFF